MDDITLLQECLVKADEEEVKGPVAVLLQPKVEVEEAEEQEVKVKTEYSSDDWNESSDSEQKDSEEEELKPLAAVYIKTEVETDEGTEEQEDHLAAHPLAGCEENFRPDYSLSRVKQEEADSGTSYERTGEQAAFNEVKNEADDGSGSNRPEYPSEEHEISTPDEDKQIHINMRPFACTHCSGTVRYRRTLQEHERENPEGLQLLTCDMCQRQFAARIALVRPTRAQMRDAEKKRNLQCETCGKEFKQRCHLKRHLHVHTGEKPYGCEQCGKRFTQGSTLNTHRRKHTGERPYCCSICNKRFAVQSILRVHTRSHFNIKPYECKECGKTFLQSSNYKVHLRTHTGERPYKCSICSKTFKQNENLKKHMRTHTGAKPY